MSNFIQSSFSEDTVTSRRLFARLDAKVDWTDKSHKEPITVYGSTHNLSSNSALVELEVLPPVGQEILLTLFDGKKELISIESHVIRVERDPAKPKAALSIGKDIDKWQEIVIPAAQEWVTNDIKLNYEGDDWLN